VNKFIITSQPEVPNKENPVLYKVIIGKNYYVHKGKELMPSVEKFLDDVYRGIRDKKYPEQYSEVVKYCKAYPQIYQVSVELILNDTPDKILKKEAHLYKSMKNDTQSLNNLEIPQYKPEWMLRHVFQEKCAVCPKNGIIDNKKVKFKFCPNCGRSIK
jgi:hypothetical protein